MLRVNQSFIFIYFSEHLVRECPNKANYVECKKCNAAVEKTLVQQHEKKCTGNKPGKVVNYFFSFFYSIFSSGKMFSMRDGGNRH
jgi:hypothetical protein